MFENLLALSGQVEFYFLIVLNIVEVEIYFSFNEVALTIC